MQRRKDEAALAALRAPEDDRIPEGLTGLEILRRCRAASDEIASLDARIRRQRETMGAFGGTNLGAVGGRGSADPDRMGRMAAKLDEIERRKAAREEEMNAELCSAGLLIDMLPDTEGEILHLYYVMGLSTGDIARKIRFAGSYVRKKKSDGEDIMEHAIAPERVAATLPAWYLRRFWADKDKR